MSLWQSLQGYEMFMTGTVAMTVDGHWMIPVYKKASFRWDVAMLPSKKQKAGTIFGSCFSIPKGAKNVAPAWKLIKFLAGEEGQKIIVGAGFSTPALKSIAKSKYFLTSTPANAKAFIKMIDYGKLEPQTPNILEIESVYSEEMDLFWQNEINVDTMAEKLVTRVDKILKKND
jgi:multiple sugar transport system substrate-binding protein